MTVVEGDSVRGTEGAACDCCGGTSWVYEFTKSEVDLGYCMTCGLHSIKQMPDLEVRMTELEDSLFAEGRTKLSSAESHKANEDSRFTEFIEHVLLVKEACPLGSWLDVGCGTGGLIEAATSENVVADGIELTSSRREIARVRTGRTIYGEPLERLKLPNESIAAITMVDVFSHLVSPKATFECVHELLKPGGVLYLRTSEIVGPARPKHQRHWLLGDHLRFLGARTIEEYADRTGFAVVSREVQWQPEVLLADDFLRKPASSRFKTITKKAMLRTPGLRSLLRMLVPIWQRKNPVYQAQIVMRKVSR